ncbi:MAG: hypothetical protein QM765_20035 [Myxococcales bacterium]
MKAIRTTAAVVFALAALASCASTSSFELAQGPKGLPGKGVVNAQPGDNGNTKLSVAVEDLGPADRVEPGASVFVVWATPSQGGAPQNLGAIHVDNNLNGKLETVTPLQSFQLFVTAEPAGAITAPTGTPILETTVVMKAG